MFRAKFQALIDKTNKENPRPQDVKALSALLVGEKSLELWRSVASAGYLAELTVIENARATSAVKECWKHRLQILKKELGSEGSTAVRATFDSAGSVVLAQTQPRGIELFQHHDAINNFDALECTGRSD